MVPFSLSVSPYPHPFSVSLSEKVNKACVGVFSRWWWCCGRKLKATNSSTPLVCDPIPSNDCLWTLMLFHTTIVLPYLMTHWLNKIYAFQQISSVYPRNWFVVKKWRNPIFPPQGPCIFYQEFEWNWVEITELERRWIWRTNECPVSD